LQPAVKFTRKLKNDSRKYECLSELSTSQSGYIGEYMRLWSLDPSLLDAKGLVALWREGLLAQKVLAGKTRGYRSHPQLERFRNTGNPCGAIADYLRTVLAESQRRGYRFDAAKISAGSFEERIPVTKGQLEYEFRHLKRKCSMRNPECYRKLCAAKISAHPLFRIIDGDIEPWETSSSASNI
jgi:hypothetical protein